MISSVSAFAISMISDHGDRLRYIERDIAKMQKRIEEYGGRLMEVETWQAEMMARAGVLMVLMTVIIPIATSWLNRSMAKRDKSKGKDQWQS